MIRFSEEKLKDRLGGLPDQEKNAFALAAATRLVNAITKTDKSKNTSQRIIHDLWTSISENNNGLVWNDELEIIMNEIPDGDEIKITSDAIKEDALSSVAYAIRCFIDPKPQEAAWAARRAYEAADQAAIRALRVRPGSPASEDIILSHYFVQRELSRQDRDISLLEDGLVDRVKQYALESSILSEEELSSIAN